MPNYGTAGDAIARSYSPPPGASSMSESDAPTTEETGEDYSMRGAGTVRDVLRGNKTAMEGVLSRIKSAETRSDALKPPVMAPLPKPPQEQQTPLSERWGSLAMTVASMSGLLTRHPLTASLSAMAQVNHAYNEGDAEAAKSAFARWKVENENAIKMAEFSNKAYEQALSKISHDYTGAISEARVMAMAMKDNIALALFESGHQDEAMRMLGARPKATRALTAAGNTLSMKQAAMSEWKQQYQAQNGRPPDAQETLRHWNEIAKETDAPGKPESATQRAEEDTDILAVDAFKTAHEGRDPGPGDQAEMARLRRQMRGEAKNEGKPEAFSAPQEISITGEDGRERHVLAQQNKNTHQWVTADESQTPISGAAGSMRIVKGDPNKAPTLSQLDAREVQRLVTEEGLSEPDARRRVQNKPETGPQIAVREDRQRANTMFKDAFGHPYDPATATDEEAAKWPDFLDAAMKTRRTASAPDKPVTLSQMDAKAVQDLMAGGMSEPEARRQVQNRPESLSHMDAAEVKRLMKEEGLSEPEAHDRVRNHPVSVAGQQINAVKSDIRTAHPEWTDGQIAMEANRLIIQSRQPAMDDDAATLNARVALKTGHAPTSMGRSQANIAKFQNAYAREARAQGIGADEIAANQAKFTGEMAESRSLGTTSARIDFGARELDVALPQARELSEHVYRPGFKKVAEIQQALQGQTSDPDLLEFAQQNQAVINAYALVMNRGGLSTVSSTDRAERMLSTATSQAGYLRQLDRLHKEVQAMIYGSQSAKQALRNEITGGSDVVTPPVLTGVPTQRAGAPPQRPSAPAAAAPKDGDTATSKSGKQMIFRGGQWQYQQQP